jgi:hypothetical protein
MLANVNRGTFNEQPKEPIEQVPLVANLVHSAESTHFPVLFHQAPSDKLMLYFHGNAEDLALADETAAHMAYYLNINIISMEYPGYGIY